MSEPIYKITGGRIFDPRNGRNGDLGDVWFRGDKIIPTPAPDVRPAREIDARGRIVMPGGVDLHSHFVGPAVTVARQMMAARFPADSPDQLDWRGLPTAGRVGPLYSSLGYTTAMDAAIAPAAAPLARAQLRDITGIDAGFYLLAGNNHVVLDLVRQRDTLRLGQYVEWLLGTTRAYAIKLVNPGGVENWKRSPNGDAAQLDSPIDGLGITPRDVVTSLAEAVAKLHLPHPVHVHCNGLGRPGNWQTTLASMKALDGLPTHLAHVQYHSYGGTEHEPATIDSQVVRMAEYVNTHDNLTVDVGQVMFGSTISLTADAPLGYYLGRLSGQPWYSCDWGGQTGCGISPIEYRPRHVINALQWAIGLEWFLLVEDAWQIALSTDHPNGASFLAYPQIIALLMDANYRKALVDEMPAAARRRTILGELTREYTLDEIAIITRAGPARMLGLANKGHLAPGADSDIAVYSPDADWRRVFELPYLVVHGGTIVVDQGEPRPAREARLLAARSALDPALASEIDEWLANAGAAG
jgi:formylmethanofuran dehydrogenase subunit A